MSVHLLERVQRLPIGLGEAWGFFSSPGNLEKITPPQLGFEPLSGADEEMYPGQIITYRVRPILGLPIFWMTEITQVVHQQRFIDEQRVGPYRLWHHEHRFRAIAGGVEMGDRIHYQLPLGPLGDLAHALFVRRQLDGIFSYRTRVLEQRFGRFGG